MVTGAAAFVRWGALFAYTLAVAGPDAVTQDWAIYMTSACILVGAEMDKLIAIGVVNGVLALALVRARRLMLREMAERRATEDLSRFVAPGVAAAIGEAELDLASPDVQRDAAVLMTDLEGFRALAASLSAEETLALLADYHAKVVPVIHRHGGAIDKYLGDGLLATFGAGSGEIFLFFLASSFFS